MTHTLCADEQLLHVTARWRCAMLPRSAGWWSWWTSLKRPSPSARRRVAAGSRQEPALRRRVIQGQTVVLLTLRADFYGKCAADPALAAALSEHQFLVGPLAETSCGAPSSSRRSVRVRV